MPLRPTLLLDNESDFVSRPQTLDTWKNIAQD